MHSLVSIMHERRLQEMAEYAVCIAMVLRTAILLGVGVVPTVAEIAGPIACLFI